MSDLPGSCSVTDADGTTLEFEYYITDKMVAANGQQVTAYYYIRGKETITRIVVGEE